MPPFVLPPPHLAVSTFFNPPLPQQGLLLCCHSPQCTSTSSFVLRPPPPTIDLVSQSPPPPFSRPHISSPILRCHCVCRHLLLSHHPLSTTQQKDKSNALDLSFCCVFELPASLFVVFMTTILDAHVYLCEGTHPQHLLC